MQKTKSVGVNKTAKVEVHITDYQSWNSCRKVASDHEFTFGSAIEPTKRKHNALDSALYMATSTKTRCLCGPNALLNTFVFCAEPRLEFCWEIIAGLPAAP